MLDEWSNKSTTYPGNQYNVNNTEQAHPAIANNARAARDVARPTFSPSLKTTHTRSKIYDWPNNSEMKPSGNLALRRAIERMTITS